MKKLFLGISVLLVGIMLFLSGVVSAGSVNQKYYINDLPSEIYLNPDSSSSVIATLDVGSVVTLASPGRFRKNFFYVYFRSLGGTIKSGYILEQNLSKKARPPKSLLLQGSPQSSRESGKSKEEAVFWGMQLSDFEKANGRPDQVDNLDDLKILKYNRKVMNLDCCVKYVFLNQGLVRTLYDFQGKQETPLPFLDEYDRMKEILVQRYGDPTLDKSIWTDTTFQADRQNWVEAVRQGHLECRAEWLVLKTEISLVLFGEKRQVNLSMEYNSPKNFSISGKEADSRSLNQ